LFRGGGTLCCGPVVFERFKTAKMSLKAKLGIRTSQCEFSVLFAYLKEARDVAVAASGFFTAHVAKPALQPFQGIFFAGVMPST
jgi:hypothetical protein